MTKDEYNYESNAGSTSNVVDYEVTVSRSSRCRCTPNGYNITDMDVCYNRDSVRYDRFQIILWGDEAKKYAESPKGTKLKIHGRLQSRIYNKVVDGSKRSCVAYEVSVNSCKLEQREE